MKALKRVLSMAMALMLIVGGLVALPQEAKAAEFAAKLGYADGGWAVQEWGENVNTTVNGSGTYTLSFDLPEGTAASGAAVFVVDIAGAQAALSAEGKTYNVTDLKVKVDGTDLAVDLTKIVTGDIENNGNFRIEIYNQYGTTKDAAPIDTTLLTASSNLTVEFTIEEVVDGYTASLGYADAAWTVQEWGENVNTIVTGEGDYTLSWDLPEGAAVNGAAVFVVDIAGAYADLLAEGKAFVLAGLSVKVDGTELAVDPAKVVTGDIEEKGNFRIEIYNQYGATKDAAPIDVNALVASSNLTVEFSVILVDAPDAGGDEDDTPAATFDPNGKYNAYIGFQTPSYSFRNEWFEPNYGLGTEYFDKVIGWVNNEATQMQGDITDAKVEGNGTYKVSVTNLGEWITTELEAAETGAFNLLFVSTDIPFSEELKVTDVKFIVDGKVVHTDKDAVIDTNNTDYLTIILQKTYENFRPEISFFNPPTSSMEVEFTIAGFAYDNGATPDAGGTEEPGGSEQTPGGNDEEPSDSNPIDVKTIIIIAVVAVVVVAGAAVVVVVAKKKAK